MTLIIAGLVILIVWAYILFIRDWLEQAFPNSAYAWWHENVEDVLWRNSRTVLVGRVYQIGGWFLGLQTMLAAAGVDTTPFTQALADFIPERYRPLVVSGGMILTGVAIVWLRKQTSGPLEDKKA